MDTDSEIELLLYAKEQGIDIRALNFLLALEEPALSFVEPTAKYWGYNLAGSGFKELCEDIRRGPTICMPNRRGDWSYYANDQGEQLIENFQLVYNAPTLTPIGLNVTAQWEATLYYKGNSLYEKVIMLNKPVDCPKNCGVDVIDINTFISQTAKDARSKISADQMACLKKHMHKYAACQAK